jgi:nitrogen regulatory protein PII
MKLLVFVLNKEELLDRVLEALIEAGVTGATILDSEGMGRVLTSEIPLFADFRAFMKGDKPYNKMILSVIKREETVKKAEGLIEEVCGDLSHPGSGILFTVPVDYAKGLITQMDE